MDLRALLREDDAVSSVLGVVLMVAVTIILAAVVGTFVLGIGSDLTDESPSASWDYSVDVGGGSNDTVLILHGGGETVDRSQVEVTIDGSTAYRDGSPRGDFSLINGQNWPEEISAGDRLHLDDASTAAIESGDMLQIIWTADSGERAAIIGEHRLN